jgi:hypothetical protein
MFDDTAWSESNIHGSQLPRINIGVEINGPC